MTVAHPILLNPSLLVYLDPVKRAKFIKARRGLIGAMNRHASPHAAVVKILGRACRTRSTLQHSTTLRDAYVLLPDGALWAIRDRFRCNPRRRCQGKETGEPGGSVSQF
uniref:Uncharacterized protein n=1 Tax=Bosea sp. NBC_00436 TaxID=2969620 RepID=A0A9E8CNJ2_9HYPH